MSLETMFDRGLLRFAVKAYAECNQISYEEAWDACYDLKARTKHPDDQDKVLHRGERREMVQACRMQLERVRARFKTRTEEKDEPMPF